jgi:alcohol oxidase
MNGSSLGVIHAGRAKPGSGGTAGCVITSPLPDVNPELSVLVIEGGPNNYNGAAVTHPALYRTNFRADSELAQTYQAATEEQLAYRAIVV